MPEPVSAQLQAIVAQSPDTRTLRLDWSLNFHPGQAVQVHFPGDEKKRFYSISSSPTEKTYVEITIKTDPAGALSSVLSRLSEGDRIPASGPFGSFSLPQDLQRPLCFISAGSGVTPIRSMIKYLIDRSELPETWLFHSVRSPQDLIFHNEITAWTAAQAQLHYLPTITREAGADWKYETGRISATLLRKHIDAEAHCFLLCGPPAFVGDMEKMLVHMGVAPAHIRREQW